MSVKLNQKALDHARDLIKANHYVKASDWSEAAPTAARENEKIERDGYEGYAKWFLAEKTEENEGTKGRYMFPYGDFSRVHRSGLAAAKQRAGEWGYDDVLKAADELMEMIPEPD
ncbi:hypothetical protein [Parvularcula dongshanensis]|uniref:Uncharacterized protein n=1 Tax=Parvularcula dongshanensis TaxID=1173995 RepID=A0A840I213_9PROT|nr:hypothetical protein [Parvularcula dongshanensis]MBB4658274.1 hypothetical protein [Parvularcula dongshanensis]